MTAEPKNFIEGNEVSKAKSFLPLYHTKGMKCTQTKTSGDIYINLGSILVIFWENVNYYHWQRELRIFFYLQLWK